jgi:hypothetical protein
VLTNLSFETAGSAPGSAASWTWTRVTPYLFEGFDTASGFSRFESFELGWGCDDFIDELVVPDTAVEFVFGIGTGVTSTAESFERSWRLPNSHGIAPSGIVTPFGNVAPFDLAGGLTLDFKINAATVSLTFASNATTSALQAVLAINHAIGLASVRDGFAFADAFGHVFIQTDETGEGASVEIVSGSALAPLGFVAGTYVGGVNATHPGNETALFAFGSAQAADFSVTQYPPHGVTFEGFERGWPTNEVYFTAFSQVSSTAAVFAPDSNAFENFEAGWADNQDYVFAFTGGDLSAGVFAPSSNAFENFESVKADQTVSPDYTASVFNCTANGFGDDDRVTIYAGVAPNGAAGAIPTGINPILTYFIVFGGTNAFELSLAASGSVVPFTDNGVAPVFVKADPSIYWTQTNVGI